MMTNSALTNVLLIGAGGNFSSTILDAFTSDSRFNFSILTRTSSNVGVKRFVPSEFGGDTANQKALAVLPQIYGKKKEVVDYLKGKEKEGLTWSAFVTGAIASGFMGFDVKNEKASLFNGGRDTWSTVTLSTNGLAVTNALLLPNETANRYLYIESLTVSQSEVVA
ncbi:hypothetical protein BDR22DRAFT_893766 [Usnea florida]